MDYPTADIILRGVFHAAPFSAWIYTRRAPYMRRATLPLDSRVSRAISSESRFFQQAAIIVTPARDWSESTTVILLAS